MAHTATDKCVKKRNIGGLMPGGSNGQLDRSPDHGGIQMIVARGPWEPVRTGFTPGQKNEFMIKWLKGEHIKIKV
jgi:hypothetical protein